MSSILKKTAAVMLSTAMLMATACNKAPGKYEIEDITLGDNRTWINEDPYYEDLVKTLNLQSYNTSSCRGCYLVATDEDVLFLYCEDSYEIDGTTSVSQYTTYDIASSSKTFTAVATLKLIEQGKLSLDDTLDKFFPEYQAGANVTIYNLLHMQSGIPDYLNDPDTFWSLEGDHWEAKEDFFQDRISDEEFIEALCGNELLFEPGSMMQYCNTNYHLLAMIVEIASGIRFDEYLQENIFTPCGMTHTTSMVAGNETSVPVSFTTAYDAGMVDGFGHSMQPNQERGDGGIHTCAADLLAFDRALFGGELLNKDSLEILTAFDMGYACGLMPYGGNGYQHDGHAFAYSTSNKIVPTEDYGYVYVIILEHN
ncbi:MAG: beta-lactamase family protein [Saccharofermentans sp.]|nr:beta-lactamase family protein [Saccharofermentans sp.]